MANISMSYETVMIFNTKLGDDAVAALGNKFKALIEENATVDKIEEWGKRRLAYPIEDELEGYYICIEFTSKPDFPAELDRIYKITDGVLRSMIIRKDEVTKVEVAKDEAPKVEAPKVEAPKVEVAKDEVAKVEVAKDEIQKEENKA